MKVMNLNSRGENGITMQDVAFQGGHSKDVCKNPGVFSLFIIGVGSTMRLDK